MKNQKIIIFEKNQDFFNAIPINCNLYQDRLDVFLTKNKKKSFYLNNRDESVKSLEEILFGDILMAYIENNSIIHLPRKNIYSDFEFNPVLKKLITDISKIKKDGIRNYKEILTNMENWQGNEEQLDDFLSNIQQIINSNSSSKFNDLLSENIIFKQNKKTAHINLAQIYEEPLIYKIKLFSKTKQAHVKAFVDTGASINLIDPSLVKKLNLKPSERILLDGISTDAPPIYTDMVKFDFEIVGENYKGSDTAAIFETITRFKTPFVVGIKIFQFVESKNKQKKLHGRK